MSNMGAINRIAQPWIHAHENGLTVLTGPLLVRWDRVRHAALVKLKIKD